jgi:hypothetical protein
MNRLHWCLLPVVNGLLVIGCSTASPTIQDGAANSNINQGIDDINRARLSEEVRIFAEDQGTIGQEAWRNLQSRSRTEVVESLVKLEQTLGPRDHLRPKIAFVLCNLDHEYAHNSEVIESALSKTPPFEGFYADDAEGLLSRLVQRGDKKLLRVLFDSVRWSDGALGEGLADTFSRELTQDPEKFLFQLKDTPQEVRSEVYKFADSLTPDEVTTLRSRLLSIPHGSPISEIGKELLNTSIFKTVRNR